MKKREEKNIEFPSLYRRVYSSGALVKTLKVFDIAAVVLVAVAYLVMLIILGSFSFVLALHLFSLSAIPFLGVSLFRKFFNAPRPYELYDFGAEGITPVGRKKGSSFPSRHVFSAFLIGSLFCFTETPVGIAVLVLGAVLAVCRVLLGIHFIRDVVAGMLIGTVLGSLGGLIIILI